MDLLVVAGAADRRDHVQPARSGGHRERLEAQLSEQVPERPRGGAHVREARSRRVEVEHDPVGLTRAIGAARPDVGRHAVLVREVHEGGVADPFGVMIAEAPVDTETILYADVDPARIEEVRHGWPFLRDRRVDAYGGLTARFLDSTSPPGPPLRNAERG